MAVPTNPGHLPRQQQPKGSPTEYKTMATEHQHSPRPKVPDNRSRESFSSVREDASDLAQTFTQTKTSSFTDPSEQAVEDSPSEMATQLQYHPPLTQPHSRLHGNWCPAGGFKGWKEINVKGKLASRSFGDLQALQFLWTTTPATSAKQTKARYAPGRSPFEQLPVELLSAIFEYLVVDIPPNGVTQRNQDLMSLMTASRALHEQTLSTLYHSVTSPHSRIFHKFLTHIAAHQSLGTLVRRLDFSHFNPSSLFSTASERAQAQFLTSESLLRCLELTPNLQEFLAQEHIETDLNALVLQKLFMGLERMTALDFAGCSSSKFRDAFRSLLDAPWPAQATVKRLSMHKCLVLTSDVFETILPKMVKLTHLDVAGTRITDAALESIPAEAPITHLNLAKCNHLTAPAVKRFLASHQSVEGMQFLSLGADPRSHQLLGVDDVTEVLEILGTRAKKLKSLSLKGSKMDVTHLPLLVPLTKHLEELAFGRNLGINDISQLFVSNEDNSHRLKYIDLSDWTGSVLDLSDLFSSQCCIMKKDSAPLDVIEVPDDVFKRLKKSPAVSARAGWRLSEIGSRTWLVREWNPADGPRDDGRRSWKMGAESWGMRKIPVAEMEVGGMYGSFMFGRKL